MGKRLVISIFIVLGVCILAISAFLLVLFLAPGFSVFGLKYIAINTHVVSYTDQRLVDVSGIGDFSGIIINTNEVPVEICFRETYSTKNSITFTYIDNFNGLTNSDFDDPSLSITKDSHGNAVFTTKEFHKWIYESSSSSRLLRLYLPMAYMIESNDNLTINSSSSSVSFYSGDETDVRVPKFNNLTVETSGKFSINNKIVANTFTLKSGNSIEIGTEEDKFVNAENYVLSSGGKIIVGREVAGDLEVTTNNGDIRFISCKNLKATTNDGAIFGASDAAPIVNGMVKINSKGGSVTLDKVLGESPFVEGSTQNEINTRSGSVNIQKIYNVVITTTLGSVNIKSVNNAKITTNMGKVKVEEALEAIDVSTKRGSVTLGGENMTLANPKVFSRMGKVSVYSASGVADIQTISSNVVFNSKNCSTISIVSGGKLDATGLKGKVKIIANKNVDVSFDRITEDCEISLADTVMFAKIMAVNNNKDNTKFYLSGHNVIRYERGANGEFSNVSTGTEISSPATTVGPTIKVTGKNAEISLYFGQAV